MPKKNNEDLQQTLLNKGIEIVLSAFNEQKKEFKKTIYELEKRIASLKKKIIYTRISCPFYIKN